jgi:general secretion pathway protein N
MRLIRRLLLLLVILAIAVAAVAWYLPASFAYRHFGHHLGPSVVLQELGGSVRQGRAGQVLINGYPVGALEWDLSIRGLLRGDIGGNWNLLGSAWNARGSTARMADGRLRVTDMHMQLPALLLQPVIDIPSLNFLGTVDVELDTLLLRGLIIDEARGRARWVDAGVTGQAQAQFGPINAHFATTAPGHVIGEVQDEAGPLEVDGQFELTGVAYHAEVILRSRSPSDPVAQMLYYVGQALPDGGSLLLIDGELKRHGDGVRR